MADIAPLGIPNHGHIRVDPTDMVDGPAQGLQSLQPLGFVESQVRLERANQVVGRVDNRTVESVDVRHRHQLRVRVQSHAEQAAIGLTCGV